MNHILKKNELLFSICLIFIYSAMYTLAEKLSACLGITSAVTAICNWGLSCILLLWIRRENLFEYYGLCAMTGNLKDVLYFLPLVIISTRNFWNGFSVNLPAIDTAFYIASMLAVGFLEELLFRGCLFRAIEKQSVTAAFLVSSLTFGLGHIVHLFDGSGMTLVANFCQVLGALGVGFLFAAVFYTTGSLLPCIITHGLYDAFSAFANETGLTAAFRIVTSIVIVIIAVAYGLTLLNVKNKVCMEENEDGNCEARDFRSDRHRHS